MNSKFSKLPVKIIFIIVLVVLIFVLVYIGVTAINKQSKNISLEESELSQYSVIQKDEKTLYVDLDKDDDILFESSKKGKDAVFEMFTRLSDRQSMSEGTGAGLFMCRKFLNMDGFNIKIHQSDENGTTFVIFPTEQNG